MSLFEPFFDITLPYKIPEIVPKKSNTFQNENALFLKAFLKKRVWMRDFRSMIRDRIRSLISYIPLNFGKVVLHTYSKVSLNLTGLNTKQNKT